MGKINRCLKYLFIFFNALFAVFGGLMILGAIQSSQQMAAVGSPVWGWLFAIGVLGISCLGIYAGHSEKEIVLKIFAGFMVVGMIIMLIFGFIMVGTKNEIESSFDSTGSKEDEELRAMLNYILKVVMGLYFGFAVTALLGLLISLLMIHQVRRDDSSGGSSIAMKGY